MIEKIGKLTLLVNRNAGFVVISGERHSSQMSVEDLPGWIDLYQRLAAKPKSGTFYTSQLAAHRRALELLNNGPISDPAKRPAEAHKGGLAV